jgi:general secretion pathway protein B
MSYILDALKKADADRARDTAAVPDLYAQADAARGARAAARPSGWWLLGLGAAGLVLAALAWRWFSAAPAEAAPPAPMAQAPAAVPVTRAPAPQPMPAIATPVLAAPAVSPPPPARERAPALPVAAKPVAPASAAGESRVVALADLPADLRSQLPALVVGGSVYSPNAASRMVILNGQVFREGDKPVEGLSVEQIRLKSSVLAFRGQRFELKH